jgi:hypothetical protein
MSIMNEIHQIFGSKSSTDYDIMFFVDILGTTQESHEIIEKIDKEYSKIYSDKPINSNICIVKGGIVVDVFKGTADEVNNALFLTYDFHEQKYPNQITKIIERDTELKILRTARVLLSFLSRTEHRKEVKRALKSDLIQKLDVLMNIDLETITDLGTRNVKWEDYLKTMSFQLGQTLALMNGIELYTKEDISAYYPELSDMLNRKGEQLKILDYFKENFIIKVDHLYRNGLIKKLTE